MESDHPLRFSSHEIEAEFLTCPVCNGNLVNKGTSLAHLLPCLHAICTSCLLINIKGQGQDHTKKINCAVCGEGHDLKSSNVKKAFPVDNTRSDLWEYIQTKKSTAAIECASVNCNNGGNVTARCVDCAEFLCDDCTLAHKRNSKTSHHDILDISKLKETENLKAFHKPLACSLHGEPLIFYCSKVSCQKPVCFMCTFTSCKESEGHTIISLEETVAQLKMDLVQQMKSLGTKKHEIQKVGTLVEREVEKLEQRERMLESDIDSTIDGMIQMLESKRAELKTTLRKKIDTKRQHLNEQKKSMDGRDASISQGLRLAETALCSTNNAAFSQIENPIRKRFDRLEHDPFDRKPHERAALIKFDTLNAKQALQKILNESVEVWSTSVFPPFTTIEICGEPRENTLAKISICLHDYLKRPVHPDVSASLKIFVVDPSEKKMALQLTKENQSDALVVSYVPFSTGKHEILIELLGEDVGRKAFIVDSADGNNTQ